MKVSFPHREDPAKTGNARRRPRSLRVIAVSLGALLIILIVFALSQPEALLRGVSQMEARWGAAAYEHDRSLAEKWSIVIGGFFQSNIDGIPEIPELVIDVPFKAIGRIYQKREQALATGHLVQGEDDFVNGDIRLNGRSIPIKLRLKGDWNDHLQGRKWSFRIRVRHGEQLLGMRRFSIQNPMTRGFQAELMYFELLNGLGLMTPRYQFVNVVLNGEPMGLMALEEFFAKELLEHRQKREGVIVRFDESLVWDARDSSSGETVGWNGSFDDYHSAAIDAFSSTKIAESTALTEHFNVAEGLLKGFADGRLSASDVFDAKAMGRLIAASDVMGAWHATRWTNLRFYLNPISLKLEPIPFDATLQDGFVDARSIVNSEPLLLDVLRDPAIWTEYLGTLEMLVRLARDGILQSNLQAVEKQWLPLLQTEFRMLGQFPVDYLLARSEALYTGMSQLGVNGPPQLSYFQPFELSLYPVLAHFELQRSGDGLILQIENAIPKDVSVVGVDWVNDVSNDRQPAIEWPLPIAVLPRGIGSMGQQVSLPLRPSPAGDDWQVETTTRINGRSWVATGRPVISAAALQHSPIPVATAAEQLATHEFLLLDDVTKTLRVRAGDLQVTSSIIVPAGYSLEIEGGTTMRFAVDAAIVSYGPIAFGGTSTSPVSLLPANDESWPGLVVMNAHAMSSMNNVIMSRTRGVSMPGWSLTGGANFYTSDVRIESSRFLNSLGEDALNIIHSGFEIHGSLWKGTALDAFDADFSHGSIADSRFEDIGSAGGGDALDVSGSKLTIDNVEFVDVADKALSIGERSEVDATNVSIRNSGTGAASKDGSLLTLRDSRIIAAKFAALATYIKKSEYGPAQIIAERVQVSGTDRPTIAQTGSRIVVDGVAVATEDVDVDALYETIMRPGLRQ